MNIRAEVLEVRTNGDSLTIVAQGKGKKDADWRPLERQTLTVANTRPNCEKYRIGRIVQIQVR
jgi:hypothetical protein